MFSFRTELASMLHQCLIRSAEDEDEDDVPSARLVGSMYSVVSGEADTEATSGHSEPSQNLSDLDDYPAHASEANTPESNRGYYFPDSFTEYIDTLTQDQWLADAATGHHHRDSDLFPGNIIIHSNYPRSGVVTYSVVSLPS
jgi:hypothetical protein